jgi:prephenate dehydratase
LEARFFKEAELIMKIGYLGPIGTFTQQAAMIVRDDAIRERSCSCAENAEVVALPSIEEAMDATSEGSVQLAVVPLENSTEGVVNLTLDSLIFERELFIQRELKLKISHCFMTSPDGKGLGAFERICSHSQSLAQCRKYLRKSHPDAELVPMPSNGEAARYASRNPGAAAIGPALAAQIYGLEILEENIQDQENNETSFIALSRSRPTGHCEGGKATIAFSTQNKPGSLYKILDIFSLWDINMTKIISRPMKGKPGEYVFYVDLEDFRSKDLDDALTMVKRKTSFYKYLGSYPSSK